jgi:hypothetical protein
MPAEASKDARSGLVDEHLLVRDLAASALERVAPEELPVFDQAAEEYFEDPEGVLAPRRRDEAIGFGLDAALVAPVVLSVAAAVVKFVAATVSEAVQENTKSLITRLVEKLFRRQSGAVQAQVRLQPLSDEQAQQVRVLALQRARILGLGDEQAALLADSLVGSLAVAR